MAPAFSSSKSVSFSLSILLAISSIIVRGFTRRYASKSRDDDNDEADDNGSSIDVTVKKSAFEGSAKTVVKLSTAVPIASSSGMSNKMKLRG